MGWTMKQAAPERRRIERAKLRTANPDQGLRRLQEATARHTRPGELLSERLIAERQAEAEREPA